MFWNKENNFIDKKDSVTLIITHTNYAKDLKGGIRVVFVQEE